MTSTPISDTHLSDVIHIMFGTAAGASPLPLALIISSGFITYQAIEIEPATDKIGDLIEFGAGAIVGKIIKMTLKEWNKQRG